MSAFHSLSCLFFYRVIILVFLFDAGHFDINLLKTICCVADSGAFHDLFNLTSAVILIVDIQHLSLFKDIYLSKVGILLRNLF